MVDNAIDMLRKSIHCIAFEGGADFSDGKT
jgi:hypothetical protein